MVLKKKTRTFSYVKNKLEKSIRLGFFHIRMILWSV